MSRVNPDAATVQDLRAFSQQAVLLSADLNVNSLRTNALLRHEEWVELDTAVVDIARARLIGIEDLRARGLTRDLGGLGTLISQWERQSDMTPANVNMAGETPGEEDTPAFDLVGVPVPIVHKDFRLNIRRILASRKLGETIDVTAGAIASRRVSDGLEDLLFVGLARPIEGSRIYGYTTHPDRNTGTAVGTWATIANIYPTVLNMIRDMHADHMWGPFVLYVAGNVWPDLLQVYDDGSGQTAMQRCLNIPGLEAIKAADALPDGEAVMVQMSRDTVDLGVAEDIKTVEWDSRGGMVSHFKVFACMVPRLKSDMSGRMGLVHYTGLHPAPAPS